ncbi:TPA: hypothetical protein ACP32N_005018 [Pseudomonas aeruginosa]
MELSDDLDIVEHVQSGLKGYSTQVTTYQHAVAAGALEIASKTKPLYLSLGLFHCVAVFLLNKLYIRLFMGGAVANGLAESRHAAVKSVLNKVMYTSCVIGISAVLVVLYLQAPELASCVGS